MANRFPEVVGPLPRDDRERQQIAALVYGEGRIDHNNQVRLGDSDPVHLVTRIHFLAEPLDGTTGGETSIHLLFDRKLEDTPWIYLETAEGRMLGWTECKGAIAWRPMMGLVVQDDDGETWFWGQSSPGAAYQDYDTRHEAWDELFRISGDVAHPVLAQNGALGESLPAEGEFSLSVEDLPVVTAIPWWSGSEGAELILNEARERIRAAKEEQRPVGLDPT